jgi:protein-arginine kinase activator protein McsA
MRTRGTFTDGLDRFVASAREQHELKGTAGQELSRVKSRIRKDFAPDPGADGAALYGCQDCGCKFWAWKRKAKTTCPDCAASRELDCQESMRRKAGPYYERYIGKQLAYLQREAARLGIRPPD